MENKYSVLMSTYIKDNPLFLKESIESILNQTRPPSEFVIIKDGTLSEEQNMLIENYKKQHPSLFKIIELHENVGLRKGISTRCCSLQI